MSMGPLVEREALAGPVERVTFHNADNGFCVLRVKVRGQRDLVTVVGAAAAVSAGEFIQASGIWLNDRTHGLQFKAAFLKTAPPNHAGGHRALPRLRHDQGHRPGLRQQAGADLWVRACSTLSRRRRNVFRRSPATDVPLEPSCR